MQIVSSKGEHECEVKAIAPKVTPKKCKNEREKEHYVLSIQSLYHSNPE